MKKLLYFSPVFWASYKQRPHFFVEYFLQKGYEVLWVEPYPSRLPKISDVFRKATLFNQQTPQPSGLTLIKLRVLPIEPLTWFNKLNFLLSRKAIKQLYSWLRTDTVLGIGKPSLIALEVLKYHKGFSFYDVMDDLPAFHRGISRRSLQSIENNIRCRVKRIFVSSTRLEKKFLGSKAPIHKILNAFDEASLPMAVEKKHSTLVLGYIGTIADWFDWDLVIRIAESFPALIIQLIGPVFTSLPKKIPQNIVLLDSIAHSEVAERLKQFSLGLIPFKLNELTESVDPIKYYEYQAMGLPVISTCFGEMAHRVHEAGVFILSKDNAVTLIDQALHYVGSLEQTNEFRKENTWAKRLAVLDQLDFESI